MAGRCKPARGEAWGILNPYGDVWTYDTFQTERAARDHLMAFWRNFTAPPDTSEFKIVRVRVTVSHRPTPAEEP
jgi:hypothetical protein